MMRQRSSSGRPAPSFRLRAGRSVLLAALALFASGAGAAERRAGDDSHEDDELHEHRHELDHDRARQALMRGEIAPLEKVLEAVRARIEGEFVGAELERDHGLWVYDLKFIDRTGRLRKIYVDARTAEIIGQDAIRRQDGLTGQSAPPNENSAR